MSSKSKGNPSGSAFATQAQVAPQTSTTQPQAQTIQGHNPTEDIERLIRTGSARDESMQWLLKDIFDDLHGYFKQKNALEYVDPLSGREWKTTPVLPLEINGTVIEVVAAVREGSTNNSPIRFFADRCDGMTLGTLEVSSGIYTSDFSNFIEAQDAHNPLNPDFSTVSAHELHKFTDSLTQWLLNNPDRGALASAKEVVGSKLKSTGRKITSIGKLFDAVRDSDIPYYAASALMAATGIGVVGGAGYAIYENSNNTPQFDAKELHLPDESVVEADLESASDVFEEVLQVDESQLEGLGNAPEILYVDEVEIDSGEDYFFEDGVQKPEASIGRVRQLDIPEEGSCSTVQTFNIPNGTVRMVSGPNTPKLLVKIHRPSVELTQGGGWGADESPWIRGQEGNVENGEVLTSATVCNTVGQQAPDFVPKGDQSLFVEFVRSGPGQ